MTYGCNTIKALGTSISLLNKVENLARLCLTSAYYSSTKWTIRSSNTFATLLNCTRNTNTLIHILHLQLMLIHVERIDTDLLYKREALYIYSGIPAQLLQALK
uniref:Uncharacterized protein n=1 Tax=Meloidogyne incognita TaxID=6306 RepID=A0A914LTP1_MELIC